MKNGAKHKIALLYFVFHFIFLYAAKSQHSSEIKALAAGDTVPDISFTKIVNFDDGELRISDYKGKAILLDFWATWCTPCVASFPKLAEIQQTYKDDLKIILFSSDKEENIRRFYSERPDFPFPTVFYTRDSLIWRLFPHRGLPHYILIDSDQRVYGITDGSSINTDNIQLLIKKSPSMMYQKNDSLDLLDVRGMIVDSIEVGSMGVRTISIDSTVLFGSQISGYDWRITGGADFSRKGYENRFLEFRNTSITNLYRMAYFGFRTDNAHNEMVLIENLDVNLDYPLGAARELIEKWRKHNSYSYRLILPSHLADSTLRYQYMQRDLKNFFGLDAGFEEREVDCLVISCENPDQFLSSGGKPSWNVVVKDRIELVNQPMKELIGAIRKFGVNYTGNFAQQRLPIIDETGLTSNIDISLIGIDSREALTEALEKKGLTLKKQRKRLNILVIK